MKDLNNDPLKEVFAAYKPEMPSSRCFMAQLGRRLDVAERVEAERRLHNRCFRRAMLVAVGVCFSAGGLVYFLFAEPVALNLVEQMLWLVAWLVLAAIVSAGILSVTSMLLDVKRSLL
ncbi:MAG: hypothetical protein ACI4AH_04945 [Muribaculaceae bacterium]